MITLVLVAEDGTTVVLEVAVSVVDGTVTMPSRVTYPGELTFPGKN